MVRPDTFHEVRQHLASLDDEQLETRFWELAEEVVGRHPGHDAVFVGTAQGLEATVVPAAGFPIELITVKGLKGKGLGQTLANLVLIPGAILRSLAILRKWRLQTGRALR